MARVQLAVVPRQWTVIVMLTVALCVTACGLGSASPNTGPTGKTSQPTAGSSHTTAATSVLTCADVGPQLRKVIADLQTQGELSRSEGVNWSAATKADVFGHAWVGSGTYAADINDLASTISDFDQGSAAVGADATLVGRSAQLVSRAPHVGNGRVTKDVWQAFVQNVIDLATACGVVPDQAQWLLS